VIVELRSWVDVSQKKEVECLHLKLTTAQIRELVLGIVKSTIFTVRNLVKIMFHDEACWI